VRGFLSRTSRRSPALARPEHRARKAQASSRIEPDASTRTCGSLGLQNHRPRCRAQAISVAGRDPGPYHAAPRRRARDTYLAAVFAKCEYFRREAGIAYEFFPQARQTFRPGAPSRGHPRPRRKQSGCTNPPAASAAWNGSMIKSPGSSSRDAPRRPHAGYRSSGWTGAPRIPNTTAARSSSARCQGVPDALPSSSGVRLLLPRPRQKPVMSRNAAANASVAQGKGFVGGGHAEHSALRLPRVPANRATAQWP